MADAVKPAKTNVSQQFGEFFRRNLNWFLAAGLALLLLQDVFGAHGIVAMRRTQLKAAQVQNETEQLNTENQQLQDHMERLKSDPSAVEQIAREEMGLARPGEYVFKIPQKADQTAAQQSPKQ